MKKILAIVFLFISVTSFAQQEKVNEIFNQLNKELLKTYKNCKIDKIITDTSYVYASSYIFLPEKWTCDTKNTTIKLTNLIGNKFECIQPWSLNQDNIVSLYKTENNDIHIMLVLDWASTLLIIGVFKN